MPNVIYEVTKRVSKVVGNSQLLNVTRPKQNTPFPDKMHIYIFANDPCFWERKKNNHFPPCLVSWCHGCNRSHSGVKKYKKVQIQNTKKVQIWNNKKVKIHNTKKPQMQFWAKVHTATEKVAQEWYSANNFNKTKVLSKTKWPCTIRLCCTIYLCKC